jgi:hypothetical protein
MDVAVEKHVGKSALIKEEMRRKRRKGKIKYHSST